MKHKGGDQKSAKKCQVSFEWYISIGKSKLKLTSGINLFHQIKCEFLSLVIPSKYRGIIKYVDLKVKRTKICL